jgi:hypothetical protein
VRYRWLYAPRERSVSAMMASGILAAQFSDETGAGFITDICNDDVKEARFVVRREVAGEVTDPFGNVRQERRVWYETTRFRVRSDDPLLELVSPPRGVRPLVSALGELTGFSMTISSVVADVMAWVQAIEQLTCGHVSMTGLRATNIPLSASVALNVELRGAEDVSEYIAPLKVRKGCVSGVSCTLESKSVRCRFALAQAGSASVGESSGDDPVPMLRQALSHVLAASYSST